MANVAAAPSGQSVIPPGPVFGAHDEAMRRTVSLTVTCVDWLYIASRLGPILGFVVTMAYGANWHDPVNVVEAAIILGMAWLIIGWLARLFFKLVVLSIRSALLAACARRIDKAMAGLPLRFSMAAKWSLPTPGSVGIDPVRRILFLTCAAIGYNKLFLRPEHILSAKVERQTTLHTTTQFSGSWGGSYGNGLMGGYFSGSAKSTTTAEDACFLEVQFRLNEHEAPRWVAVPFTGNRQWAESWVIAINELRR